MESFINTNNIAVSLLSGPNFQVNEELLNQFIDVHGVEVVHDLLLKSTHAYFIFNENLILIGLIGVIDKYGIIAKTYYKLPL